MQKGRKIGSLPGLIFWVTALFCDVFFLVRYGREYMDSDIAAEIILSSLKQTGPVFFINSNWYYSTELRVLNLQPLYKIGLLLSPDRSYIARAIGMAIAFLLVSAAVWLFCRACDLGSYAEWMAAFTLCPVSFWYQYQTIFGGQYLTYIIISFWALLALVKVSRSKNKTKMYCWGALLMVIAFLTGMQGVR